jgi:hypothetical protein
MTITISSQDLRSVKAIEIASLGPPRLPAAEDAVHARHRGVARTASMTCCTPCGSSARVRDGWSVGRDSKALSPRHTPIAFAISTETSTTRGIAPEPNSPAGRLA